MLEIARDFVKLKSSVKDISFPFIQAEYHVFLPCFVTLLLLCLFSKNKKTIIVLKRQKHQPRNTKGFIVKKKSHRFNLTSWVITCKITLTYFLVAYKSEKNEIPHSSSLIKQDFDSYEFIKEQNMLRESHNSPQHQLYTFSKLKTNNFNTFIRFAILLSGDIQVNAGPNSNLCDSCGKRINKRCLCCTKCNVKIHKKCKNMRIFESGHCNKCETFITKRLFRIIGKPTIPSGNE